MTDVIHLQVCYLSKYLFYISNLSRSEEWYRHYKATTLLTAEINLNSMYCHVYW
jgi:hypothetical protein